MSTNAISYCVNSFLLAKPCLFFRYIDGLFNMAIKKYMLEHAPMPGGYVATYPDFLAAGLIFAFALILMGGVKLSSSVNIAVTTLNVAVIIFIIGQLHLNMRSRYHTRKVLSFSFGRTKKISRKRCVWQC